MVQNVRIELNKMLVDSKEELLKISHQSFCIMISKDSPNMLVNYLPLMIRKKMFADIWLKVDVMET